MGAVCFGGQGITMTHRQDKSLLPKDCAKYCEDDEDCLAWDCVPSTVPAALKQFQGCYMHNQSWDGTRSYCPYGGDSSGCSTRGVVAYKLSCCFGPPPPPPDHCATGGWDNNPAKLWHRDCLNGTIYRTVPRVNQSDCCAACTADDKCAGWNMPGPAFEGVGECQLMKEPLVPWVDARQFANGSATGNLCQSAQKPAVVECQPAAWPPQTCPGGDLCPNCGSAVCCCGGPGGACPPPPKPPSGVPGMDILKDTMGMGEEVGTLTCTPSSSKASADADDDATTTTSIDIISIATSSVAAKTAAAAGGFPDPKCLSEIAAKCKAQSNCSNFAMSAQWHLNAAQAFDGVAAHSKGKDGKPTCNPGESSTADF